MSGVGNVEKPSLWAASSCQSAPSAPDLSRRALQEHFVVRLEPNQQQGWGVRSLSISYFEKPDICPSAQCADWTDQNGRRQSQQKWETINKNSERFLRQTSTRHPVLWATPSLRKGGGEGWGSQEGKAQQLLLLLLQVEGSCHLLSWNHIMCELPSTVPKTHRRMA